MTYRSPIFRYVSFALVLSGTTLALGAGMQAARTAKHASAQAPSSVQETMLILVDPSADALWGSISTVITAKGRQEHRPHTAADWLKLTREAESLVAGAQRLQTPGLPVTASPENKVADSDVPGARNTAQISADVKADPARFRAAAIRLEEAAKVALAATRAHDVDALFNAGDTIDQACENCHQTFWYPQEKSQKTAAR